MKTLNIQLCERLLKTFDYVVVFFIMFSILYIYRPIYVLTVCEAEFLLFFMIYLSQVCFILIN